MAWSRERMSPSVSDFYEKTTHKHFWADIYADSEPLLGKNIMARPITIGASLAD